MSKNNNHHHRHHHQRDKEKKYSHRCRYLHKINSFRIVSANDSNWRRKKKRINIVWTQQHPALKLANTHVPKYNQKSRRHSSIHLVRPSIRIEIVNMQNSKIILNWSVVERKSEKSSHSHIVFRICLPANDKIYGAGILCVGSSPKYALVLHLYASHIRITTHTHKHVLP